ncbi:hypothetical protein H7I01_15695 [Mycobacterium palustre]|nr:hypothetical protein [Mycobacterium palustre]MCV7101804.1 hypothetical protein [Mycobacterium palustre]
MASFVLDAAEGDVPGVIAVLQHCVQLCSPDWLFDLLLRRTLGEAAYLQRRSQAAEAPLAGGIGFERPADVVSALGVNDDVTILPPVDEFTDVQVAERRTGDGAAGARFLCKTLHNLLCKIAGVKLGDGAHNSVQQRP